MNSANDGERISIAPELSATTDEKAHLEHEKFQLAVERDAFEHDRKREWATIDREKQALKEQKDEAAQMKQRLMFGISEYFWKKAELESGLIPAPRAPGGSRAQLQPESDMEEQHSPMRMQGRSELSSQLLSLAELRSPSALSPAQFADDEREGDDQPATVPKRKRGRPRLNKATQNDAADKSPRPPRKRGRPKLYHRTEYGTKLPLAYLSPDGVTIDAQQVRTQRAEHWDHVVRFIKDHQQVAGFRLRTWLEERIENCMSCFVDLKVNCKWTAGRERLQACDDCQKSGTPCIVLDPTGTMMILLPRDEEFQGAS